MKKRRLYMVQACSRQDGFLSIPYSIGVLAAYVWQDSTIRKEYTLCGLIGEKFDWDISPGVIDHPDVVAFSCYMWNFEYNKYLACKIKEQYPSCNIIFGGHSIPITRGTLLLEFPFIDYLLHGEGELPLTELLLCLCGRKSLEDVHNVSYRAGDGVVYRYDPRYVVQDYPSPYLTGILEQFLDFKKERYTATLETNRGCPFHCGYCDWGLSSTSLRMMDLQKVLGEIEWMGKHRIFTCYGADSNFGMFPRDVEIAKKLVETKRKYGHPKKFSVSFSKRSDERVLKISRILNDAQALAGATLSFQSLDPGTLRIIGRENLSLDYFQKLLVQYNKYNIPTYSEIILALPGETYDTFVDGLCTLVANGQYRYINVYDFALLANSELGRLETVETYGIRTVKIPQKTYYCPVEERDSPIQEVADIVVETSSMSRADWVRCRMFATILKGFHSYGILLYTATFLHCQGQVSIRAFYESLCQWIGREEGGSPFVIYADMERWLYGIAYERNMRVDPPDRYGGYVVPAEEAAFLKLQERLDLVYERLEDFLRPYDTYDFWGELLRFQRTVMRLIYDQDCPGETFSYDFISYFNAALSGKPGKPVSRPIRLTSDSIQELLMVPKKIYVSQKKAR